MDVFGSKRVLTVISLLMSEDNTLSLSTWKRRTAAKIVSLASSGFSQSGTVVNAASVGPRTVKGPGGNKTTK